MESSNLSSGDHSQRRLCKRSRFAAVIAELFPGTKAVSEFSRGVEKLIRIDQTAGGEKRGRADAYYGNAIIEFEKSLSATLEEAKRQLCEYVAGTWQKEKRKSLRPLLAIATDGIRRIRYRPVLPEGAEPTPETVVLDELSDFRLAEDTLGDFWLWLTSLLFREQQAEATAEQFQLEFGSQSFQFHEGMAALKRAWAKVTQGGTEQMKRAALYVRVSTPDQHVESQLYDLRELAAQRGFEVVHEYEDRGVCGKKARRPGLDALMADARRKKFSVVLVAAFDRIARSTRNFLQVIDELDSMGIEFISRRENVDTSGPMGRLFVTIISAIAELERSLVVDRVKSGMRRAKLEGRQIGRARLDVNREQVVQDRRSGMSLTQVAKKHRISRASVCRLVKEASRDHESSVSILALNVPLHATAAGGAQ